MSIQSRFCQIFSQFEQDLTQKRCPLHLKVCLYNCSSASSYVLRKIRKNHRLSFNMIIIVSVKSEVLIWQCGRCLSQIWSLVWKEVVVPCNKCIDYWWTNNIMYYGPLFKKTLLENTQLRMLLRINAFFFCELKHDQSVTMIKAMRYTLGWGRLSRRWSGWKHSFFPRLLTS